MIPPRRLCPLPSSNVDCETASAAQLPAIPERDTAHAISALVAVYQPGRSPTSPPAAIQVLYTINSGTLYQMVVPLSTSAGKATLGYVSCNSITVSGVC